MREVVYKREKTAITHRHWTDWEYKAVSCRVNDDGILRDIIYYNVLDKGQFRQGIEIYSGRNFIVKSLERSYSRHCLLCNCPIKYKVVVANLVELFNEIEWEDTPEWEDKHIFEETHENK